MPVAGARHDGTVRETTAAAVAAGAAGPAGVDGADDPFLRHHLDPAPGLRAWALGSAVAVEQPDRGAGGLSWWVVGPAGDVGPLLRGVAAIRSRPGRVLVDLDAFPALPGDWAPTGTRAWHWMWTSRVPAPPARAVVAVEDADEVADFLARAYPGSFARPGDADVECWLGVRAPEGDPCGLAAVGALVRRPDGTGYVRAVSVLPAYRGRGLARDVSAALTRRALEVGTGVATLGVFVDNEPALAVYRGLGYAVAHTFCASALA